MNPIEIAKGDFLQAKGALQNALRHVPEDRLNWSPAPTARTPLQIGAHSAAAFSMISRQLGGQPFEIKSTDEADRTFREWERQYTARAQVDDLIESRSSEYMAWLESLVPDTLDANWILPFGLGEMRVGDCLGIVPMHTRTHVAQIEYLQTIWGDQDWHVPAS